MSVRQYGYAWRPGGFTLLEALVAIVLAGLVLGILGTSFRFSLKDWEREQEGENGGLHAAMRLLAAQLASYEPMAQGGDAASILSLRGDASQLVFPTFVSMRSLHGGGPVLARYIFTSSNNEGVLYYAEKSLDENDQSAAQEFQDWQPGDEVPDDVAVLAVAATELSFAFERTRDRGRFEKWEHIAELPEAVLCRYRAPGDPSAVETAFYPGALDFDGGEQ